MHPSVARLTPLPPRSQRFINLQGAAPIPLYFIQVPQTVLQDIRGAFSSTPPIWPMESPLDRDGERTWRIVCSNNVTVYIRSQPVPNDPPGVWALSPSQEEIFIPQSLLGFEIRYPNPTSPPLPSAAAMAGPRHIPTLITHLHDHSFHGRRCKVCGGQDEHDMYCPSVHLGFSCGWCSMPNGSHKLGCSGFVYQ